MTRLNKLFVRLSIALLTTFTLPLYAIDVQTHLQNNLNAMQFFSADFSQRVIDIERTIVKPSTGSMSFKRPGKFVWSYREPYEQDIISDGEQIWIYDKDLEQVTIRPVGDELTQTPIKILDNPANINEHYKIELLSENGDEVEIQLTPLNEDAGFKYVILIFNEKGLTGMDIFDSFDHYNSLTFDNIDRQTQLDDELFAFVTPAGVDVINATE